MLIDCPCIPYNLIKDNELDIVLKGVMKENLLNEPSFYVSELLRRVKTKYLNQAYNLKSWSSPNEFLTKLAQRSGNFQIGGGIDLDVTAMSVLRDWFFGRIPFVSIPYLE